MARITITADQPYGPPTIEGWFDPDKSDHYPEERTEDLEGNRTGVCSGSRWVYESLYRTPGGRWVHRVDGTSHFDGRDEYRFIGADAAQAWLLRSGGHDDALERWFSTAEEEGPSRGRPRIGDPITIAFPAALLADVDAAAAEADMSRAEWIRGTVRKALGK